MSSHSSINFFLESKCFERGHYRSQCPKNAGQGNGGARGRVYVMGNGEQHQDPNVVTGTFFSTTFVLEFCLIRVPIRVLYLLRLRRYSGLPQPR